MIWVRRLLAIVLGLLFVLFLLLSALLLRVEQTFLSPTFINRELRRAEVFTFLYDEALPVAARENADQIPDLPLGIDLTPEMALDASRQVLPAPWLQAQVEEAVNAVLPYMLGETDSFAVSVPLQDRVGPAADAAKQLLEKSGAYRVTLSPEFSRELDRGLDSIRPLPLGLSVPSGDVAEAAGQVLPPEWLRRQAERSIDAVTPYLAGQEDEFTVTIPLADRVDAAVPVLKRLLRRTGAYEQIRDEMVRTVVEEGMPRRVELPFGQTVTSEELAEALRHAVPADWVRREVEEALDEVSLYMVGRQDHFEVRVSLTGFVAAVTDQALGVDVPTEVEHALGERLPSVYTFTDSDLRDRLGPEQGKGLDRAREVLRDGWTFTQEDLKQALEAEQWDTLQEARGTIAGGWTFTDADLLDAIEREAGQQAVDQFNGLRGMVDLARSLGWLAYLVWALLLVAVGLLGGRSWAGRLGWASAFLALGALVTFLATGPLYAGQGEPLLSGALAPPAGAPEVERVAMAKAQEVVAMVARDFLAGPHALATRLLGVGAIGLAAGAGMWLALRVQRGQRS